MSEGITTYDCFIRRYYHTGQFTYQLADASELLRIDPRHNAVDIGSRF